MIRHRIKQFKLFAGVLVAVCSFNTGVAQATDEQQFTPRKQLSSQPLCQCACDPSQYTSSYTHIQKHKRSHAHAQAPCKHVHHVQSAHPVRSAHVVRSVPPSKYSSSSTAQYKPLSSSPSSLSKLGSGHKIIFQAGAFNSSQGRTQDVYINNVYDIYTVSNHNSQNVLLGLGYYIDGFDKPRYGLWYGLNVFYLAPSTVKGNIIQEGLYTNLSYRYTITQFPIYLDIKGILHTNSPQYDITLDLAAGPSIVSTSDVKEYALNSNSIPDKIFKGGTSVLPSFSAGIGLKVNNLFSNETSVECGYRFFYTTQTKFNHYFDSTPSSGPLYTGNNFVNSVMCSIIL